MKLLLTFVLLLVFGNCYAFVAGSGIQLCGQKATLYAFYEGSHPLLHKIPLWKEDRSLTFYDYINRAQDHLRKDSPKLQRHLEKNMYQIFGTILASYVQKLPITKKETDVVFLDEGCSYITIAGWDDSFTQLFIDVRYFALLSPMHQAGLIIQESFHKLIGETKSDITRNTVRPWVSRIFSDESLYVSLIRPEMTPEEKSEASKPYCSISLKYLTDQIKVFTKTVKGCAANGKEGYVTLYKTVSNFMNEAIEDCLKNCFWDKAVKTCNGYKNIVDQWNYCD